MDSKLPDFENLTPELVIEAAEAATDIDFSNYTQPMPSYINRVYELKSEDDGYYIAKFYRPGRWSSAALLQEHRFMLDCAEDDIPVAAPLPLEGLAGDGSPADAPTLGAVEGIPFAVFPRKGGRLWEAGDFESWYRMGSLLGRLHNCGARRSAPGRIELSAEGSFSRDIDTLLASDWIHPDLRDDVALQIKRLESLVKSVYADYAPPAGSYIRVHGDFHSGNILERPGEGLMLMDFDDMAMSVPVQDLWLVLPDYAPESSEQITALVDGYREFRSFNTETLRLIEPLRAMRMIYFLCWCGRQKNDYRFQHNFPDWGCKAFWNKEIQDISNQHDQIIRALENQRIIP